MKEQAYDDQTIRQYLLGALPEAETERIDELCFIDDDFDARVQTVERELVDEYVCGELAGPALAAFDSHYLASPRRRERVKFAHALRILADRVVATPQAAVARLAAASELASRRRSLREFFAVPVWRWGFAGALMLALVAGGWLIFEILSVRNQAGQVQAPPQRREKELQALAATTILQHKGRVLDLMSNSFGALRRRADPQDQVWLDRLNDTRTRLATLARSQPEKMTLAEYREELTRLGKKKEELEAEISRRSAEFRAQSQPVTLEAIQSAIPANAVLIEFAVYHPFTAEYTKLDDAFSEPRYIAYVLRHRGEVQWKELGGAKEMDAAIAALRGALRDPERKDVKSKARAVDEKAMRPVRALLGEAKHLLVSPDGALRLIPFEALVDEQNRYLIARYSITYLTSGRDLLRLQAPRESKSNPLVIANPDYDRLPEQLTANVGATAPNLAGRAKPQEIGAARATGLSKLKFTPLPQTDKEAEEIGALLPEATVLTGKLATEAALKQAAAPRVLHIATHGFFLEDQPEKIQAPRDLNWPPGDDDGIRLGASVKIEDPLLRSGLALEGANLRRAAGDDGILTAAEASELNLWGTKLVVLSACDTGLGEVKVGEGGYSLRRALVLAGAETQVMSLWRVDDYATRRLMTEYYTNLNRGLGRGEALRQAQLKILEYHPYYWAGFIQSGEWASLAGKR